MRLSFHQFLVLALLPLVGMMACDIPLPSAPASGTLPDLSTATVLTGKLTNADGNRASGQKADEVAMVTVPPGATLYVLMESEAFDTFLEVRVAGLSQSLTNDDWNGSQRQSFVSQQNTTAEPLSATVLASAYAEAGRGAYTVKYLVDEPEPLPEADPLALPAEVSWALSNTTPHVPLLSNDDERPATLYSFSLASGQSATVRMESVAFDPYLKVLKDGAFHARNDDFGGSREVSQVEVTGPGTFTVFAGAFSATANTGAYTLTVTASGGGEKPQTPVAGSDEGGTYRGEITDGDADVPLPIDNSLRKADAYEVELSAGETLVATMESMGFDSYLKLVRGSEFVARNDDAGSTRRSEIRHTAAASGTYTIYAGTFTSSGRGAYTLTWRVE